ncbi:type II secretory pathway pseudopilin PulG [Bradyrhizobium sp. USDA 4341]
MKLDTKVKALRRQRRARQQGLTLIESAVALGIVAIMLATFGQMVAQNQQSIKSRAAALQLQQVTNAASQYIQTNYGQVLNNTPVGSVSYIPAGQTSPGGAQPVGTAGMQSLQQSGFLSNTYVDNNPYGQQTALLVTQPATAPGRLEAMLVTYGGQKISDDELGRIATAVGAAGGFMPAKPTPNAGGAGQILGSYGGWRSTAATWAANGGGVVPSAGHAMATLAFQNGALLQDFLYRHDIGNPDANSMYTDVHMQGNGLNGVGVICGGTAQVGCSNMSIDMNNDSITNLGTITAAGNALNLNGSLNTTGDVNAGGNVKTNTGYVQAGALPPDANQPNWAQGGPPAGGGYFQGDLRAGGDAHVNGDGFFGQSITVDSDVVAGGKVVGKERVITPKINDLDNLVYSVDPNGMSSFSMLNPRMLNLDTYVFGASINKPVVAQDPSTLTLDPSLSQDDKLRQIDNAQNAFYSEAYSKYGQAGNTAVRLGDLLPRYALQRVYLLTPYGATYTTLDPTTNQPITQTIPASGNSQAPVVSVPWPTCTGGVPEMYLSRVDESQSYALPVTTSVNQVGVVPNGNVYVNAPPYTSVAGTYITASSVVTDVQTGGVNFAPNAQVSSDTNSKSWSVLMTAGGQTGGEMVQGTNGANQTVTRRLMAQSFCHFLD